MIDVGELDGSFGVRAENEDDSAEGSLDAHEDIFYICDEQNESWFQGRPLLRPQIGQAQRQRTLVKAAAEAMVAGDSSNHVARRRAVSGRSQPRRLVLAS